MWRTYLALTALLISLTISGCAAPSGFHVIHYEPEERSPKSRSHPIQVVHQEDIHVPFKIIGNISIKAGEKRDPGTMLERLRTKARSMGADALMDYTIIVPLQKGGIPEGWVRYTADVIVYEDKTH